MKYFVLVNRIVFISATNSDKREIKVAADNYFSSFLFSPYLQNVSNLEFKDFCDLSYDLSIYPVCFSKIRVFKSVEIDLLLY